MYHNYTKYHYNNNYHNKLFFLCLTYFGPAVLNVLDTTGVKVTQEKMSQRIIIATWKSKFRSNRRFYGGN